MSESENYATTSHKSENSLQISSNQRQSVMVCKSSVSFDTKGIMTQMVSFNLQASVTVGSALFWRIVDWCLREGANEFTLSVYGFDGVQSAQGRFAQIKELLQPYKCSAAKRRKPSGCV